MVGSRIRVDRGQMEGVYEEGMPSMCHRGERDNYPEGEEVGR